MKRPPANESRKQEPGKKRLYTLNVSLLSGPVTEEFVKANKEVRRTIQIRGDQTLKKLHEAIFDAFDRDEEHMYEFQLSKRLHDPRAKRYVLPMDIDDPFSGPDSRAESVTRTRIESMGLKLKQRFIYWFDFGDDWFHEINVVGIDDEIPKGRYPAITERVGESPPQYPDWGNEDEAWDDENEDEEDWDDEDED
ncbi:MAG: plasmid pRiA4b ORF-3 family protein [Phycisphaerales bacterium]|nr:MAG: plasmid pRiA4b ORF-3 family protein [Phycisphaerales bacterium]